MEYGSGTGLRGPLQAGWWLRAASPYKVDGAGRGRGLQLAAAFGEGQQHAPWSYAPLGLGYGGQQHVPYDAGGPRADGNSGAPLPSHEIPATITSGCVQTQQDFAVVRTSRTSDPTQTDGC